MKLLYAWLPSPVTSSLVALLWLLLQDDWSISTFIVALLLAIFIPKLTASFRPDQLRIKRLRLVPVFFARLLQDIILANLQVVPQVLGKPERLKPAFIWVEVPYSHPVVITMLAAAISLTPGTVSADIRFQKPDELGPSPDTKAWLLLHVLHLTDETSLIEQLQQRYVRLLQEAFQC